jgi:hypothetical protein
MLRVVLPAVAGIMAAAGLLWGASASRAEDYSPARRYQWNVDGTALRSGFPAEWRRGSLTVEVFPLQISFAHRTRQPGSRARKRYAYAGYDASGMPITEHPRTLILYRVSPKPAWKPEPDQARLVSPGGRELLPDLEEKVFLASDAYRIPRVPAAPHWTGVLVFPELKAGQRRATLRLPYTLDGQRQLLTLELERKPAGP